MRLTGAEEQMALTLADLPVELVQRVICMETRTPGMMSEDYQDFDEKCTGKAKRGRARCACPSKLSGPC